MPNATHLRRRAELCFAIAQVLSHPADAKVARQTAEQYVRRAENTEKEQIDSHTGEQSSD
jgi:hypothetical protein